jgi:hypothetical protein
MTNIVQTAPTVEVLPQPSQDSALARGRLTVWDEEGNNSMPSGLLARERESLSPSLGGSVPRGNGRGNLPGNAAAIPPRTRSVSTALRFSLIWSNVRSGHSNAGSAAALRQILIWKQEFLVGCADEIRDQSLPSHRPKVKQHRGLRAIFPLTCNLLEIDRFDRFDLTGSLQRRKMHARDKFLGCTNLSARLPYLPRIYSTAYGGRTLCFPREMALICRPAGIF